MTAVPGVGALALPCEEYPPLLLPPEERPFEPPDEEPDEDDDDEDEDEGADWLSLSCCANGSLLAKRLNDDSCPSSTFGAGDDASEESADGVDAGVSLPLSEGAARLGVPVVVVARSLYDGVAWDAGGCSCFHSFGPWNATTPRNTTPRTAATIFCFFCFALRTSTRLFAITELPSPMRWRRAS